EDLVATLVRLRREARPAPEELTTPPSMRPRAAHESRPRRELRAPPSARPRREHPGAAPRREHLATDGAAWFAIDVGRSKNADPKWLIPLLCRRGNITKAEIGKIQILARETRVE